MRRFVGVLMVAFPLSASAVDVQLTHQGRLLSALGEPSNGPATLEISLWSDANSTDAANDRLFAETFVNFPVEDGYYSVRLGESGGLDATMLAGDVFVQVSVGGGVLLPRAPIAATPVAAQLATPVGDSVPAGAVMPFDLTSCPSGWSTYTPAQGRFIRGLDTAGTIDPDGASRSVGSVQADAFASHTHESLYWSSETTGSSQRSNVVGNGGTAQGATRGTWVSQARGDAETRPDNVALLYCRKD